MNEKLPKWIKKRLYYNGKRIKIKKILKELEIRTVCQEAKCPNIVECFSKQTATFMILGSNCTRNCKFCAISSNKPDLVNEEEPQNIAKAVKELKLEHVVITSVTRDDLEDNGVKQFINTVKKIKEVSPNTTVEILVPDFNGDFNSIKKLKNIKIDIIGHNIDTVPRLYKIVKPEASYNKSLKVLSLFDELKLGDYSKSGLMLGLGEKIKEVKEVLCDLRKVNCNVLTIGQYLSPSNNHLEVKNYITPKQFLEYKYFAENIGFKKVESGPFVRSSYNAKNF